MRGLCGVAWREDGWIRLIRRHPLSEKGYFPEADGKTFVRMPTFGKMPSPIRRNVHRHSAFRPLRNGKMSTGPPCKPLPPNDSQRPLRISGGRRKTRRQFAPKKKRRGQSGGRTRKGGQKTPAKKRREEKRREEKRREEKRRPQKYGREGKAGEPKQRRGAGGRRPSGSLWGMKR